MLHPNSDGKPYYDAVLEESWSSAARKAAALARQYRVAIRDLEKSKHEASQNMLRRHVENLGMGRPMQDTYSKSQWAKIFDANTGISRLRAQQKAVFRGRPLIRKMAKALRGF